MPLRLYIKPHERFLIGDALVENGHRSITLTMLTQTPVLRQKDILTPDQANTLPKQLQYITQCILLSAGTNSRERDAFEGAATAVIAAHPNSAECIAAARLHLQADRFYQALQCVRTLEQAVS